MNRIKNEGHPLIFRMRGRSTAAVQIASARVSQQNPIQTCTLYVYLVPMQRCSTSNILNVDTWSHEAVLLI